MKRKHFELGVLFLVGLIVLGLLYLVPTLTGFAVSQEENTVIPYTDGFEVHDLEANVKSGIAKVDFYLKEKDGENRDLTIHYELFNAKGDIFERDKVDLILSAKDDSKYTFSFKVPENAQTASLGLDIVDNRNNERIYASTLIRASSVSGNAIEGSNDSIGKIGVSFVAFILLLSCLAYVMKLIYARKARKSLVSEIHQGRLIKLR